MLYLSSGAFSYSIMAFGGRFVLNLIYFAADQGASVKDLLAISRQTSDSLCQESSFVSDADYNKVVESCIQQTGDNCFGLHAGESLNLTAAGLIGQITHTSATVKEALEWCCEFANLGCSALPMKMRDEQGRYFVSLTPNELWTNQSPEAVRHTTEGVIAFTIREFQSLTRLKHVPLAIHLTWPRNEHKSELERVFGCPVIFGSEEIGIALEKPHVEEAVVTADYHLLRVLVKHAEEKSAEIKSSQGFLQLVKRSIIRLVKPNFPGVEDVASHLNMSARTLQRKLKSEDASFSAIIDEVRKEFALSYIKRPDLNMGDIAYLLNYTDLSTFNRSFKRWTGYSPSNYRKNHV